MPVFQRFMGANVTVKMPTAVAIVLGLLAGVAQVLNAAVFTYSAQVHAGVAVFIVFLAGMGISPLVGEQFRSGLHLPGWAYTLITSLLSAAVLAIASLAMPKVVHAIVATVITVATALGFSPTVASVAAMSSKPVKGKRR